MSSPAWVLDTNVLVSGLINPHGHPGRLMDAVLGGHLELALDDRIYSEYAEVLRFRTAARESGDPGNATLPSAI